MTCDVLGAEEMIVQKGEFRLRVIKG
jgi:hypothetical protein